MSSEQTISEQSNNGLYELLLETISEQSNNGLHELLLRSSSINRLRNNENKIQKQ